MVAMEMNNRSRHFEEVFFYLISLFDQRGACSGRRSKAIRRLHLSQRQKTLEQRHLQILTFPLHTAKKLPPLDAGSLTLL